ncbi:NAD-glutamate dehydrogenase, partial [Dactylosporangium sp. NPDC005555]
MNRPTVTRVSTSTAEPVVEDDASEQYVPDAEHLVAEAVVLAAAQDADPELVARYWRLVPDEELAGCRVARMVEATRSHLELARRRVPGELKLRVGMSVAGGTSLEIVTDDMPFLVDSVTSALSARNLDVNLLVHPLVVVRRQPLGALEEVRVGLEPEDADPGDIVESWIRIEVDRIPDEADLEDLRNDLARVLNDVREAVEDWPRMRTQALTLADELGSAQLPVPDKDVTDSVELLRWLVDDHFTFLGYREYRLIKGDDGEELMQAVPGSGLGILRADQTRPRVLSSMTAEAYARALEKRLLIITKANSRATVHRSAYLDYIGFKL